MDPSFTTGNKFTVTGDTLAKYIQALYAYGVRLVIVLAVIMIMVAGFQWAMSAGRPDMISTAKKRLNNAIIGLLLSLFTVVLLNFINPALVSLPTLVIGPIKLEELDIASFKTEVGLFVEKGGNTIPPVYLPFLSSTTSTPILSESGGITLSLALVLRNIRANLGNPYELDEGYTTPDGRNPVRLVFSVYDPVTNNKIVDDLTKYFFGGKTDYEFDDITLAKSSPYLCPGSDVQQFTDFFKSFQNKNRRAPTQAEQEAEMNRIGRKCYTYENKDIVTIPIQSPSQQVIYKAKISIYTDKLNQFIGELSFKNKGE